MENDILDIESIKLHSADYVDLRNNGFDSDDIKDNVEQIFKQISPNTQIRSI